MFNNLKKKKSIKKHDIIGINIVRSNKQHVETENIIVWNQLVFLDNTEF